MRFAHLVGRERVIASTDCGLGGRVHPDIAWAKLQALTAGADRATNGYGRNQPDAQPPADNSVSAQHVQIDAMQQPLAGIQAPAVFGSQGKAAIKCPGGQPADMRCHHNVRQR